MGALIVNGLIMMKSTATSRVEFENGARWETLRASYFKGLDPYHYDLVIQDCQQKASWYLERALDCPDAFEQQN